MNRTTFYVVVAVAVASIAMHAPKRVSAQQPSGVSGQTLAEPSPSHLPRWRGFNLLEKFIHHGNNGPFQETDFQWISQFGFNFVRLPMDYRVWIEDGDWNRFNEKQLAEIDQAVRWGQKYSIHVSINFHRAPGYTVARPAESTDLWTDPQTQQVCAKHWAMFARRYRDVSNRHLSFNLFNEPANITLDAYLNVVRIIADAIRSEDPDRLIISDGLNWGKDPIAELVPLKIAHATRGYTPMDVTHYRASWVSGADRYPVPTWPRVSAYGNLYATNKAGMSAEAKQPLVIEGDFRQPTKLRVRVDTVSDKANLVAKADGVAFWEKHFACGPGEGEWKVVKHVPQWDVYQNVYDRDYVTTIPEGTKRVELSVNAGDWLSLSEIGITDSDDRSHRVALRSGWDNAPAQLVYDPAIHNGAFWSEQMEDKQWLWETTIIPWTDIRQQGSGVMVGEFGCHNQTPHPVTLSWMEDCLQNWQRAEFGWALWNFRGSFGILDSNRQDLDYEDFHGHKLDRKMLTLLQQY